MTDDRQHRIRQRAHAIWESRGRLHGHDRDHWDEATREVDAEDAAAKKNPVRVAAAAKPKAVSKPAAVAKGPAAKKPGVRAKTK
ncbi:MAG TPA: DUF2934 domain-containing protein [Rhizobiaceae bacterium]